MHKGLKAVLFDFDGVIVDTEEQYTEFWADVARHYLPKEKDFQRESRDSRSRMYLTDTSPTAQCRNP